MTDSTPEIVKKQLEIILSKSESERFRIGADLTSFGRKVLESSIRQEYSGITGIEIKIEVLKRCYSSFYSVNELNLIILSMTDYFRKENKLQGK
jgi:hypothetical protein